ncbi:response regulator [Gammaproteobacteria bacterium LSUCC0112]|nr:response regulator [Gammaproteobacteria bacterium LSUCC0112]
MNFEVRDTGIGIPHQQQQEIFQALVQGDSSITRRYGGTGLGLTISSALVQLMGGQIHVISEVGKGSVFYFELDFEVAQLQGDKHAVAALPADQNEPDLQPLIILLVEDNPMNQMLAVKILQNDGHTVDVANNGLEALQKAEQRDYDLVLMDLQMPVMDGLEARRRIRESEQQTGKHLPVIAMTAHALPEVKDSCIEAGMDDSIAEPVRRSDLFAVLTLTADRFKLRHDA